MQGFWGARQAENQQESTAEGSTQQSSTPLLNGLRAAAKPRCLSMLWMASGRVSLLHRYQQNNGGKVVGEFGIGCVAL